MIYFLVTTSIFIDCPIRENQYIKGITTLKKIINDMNFENYKIIIIENNGSRDTFLNNLDCEVYYTTNNFIPNCNKGYKELMDILNCINRYNINDSDFIVKMTGRYILDDNSEFMNIIKDIDNTKYDCVIHYGTYGSNGLKYKIDDCVTGLIGMTSFYIKQIEKPSLETCVEWNWAKVTRLIDDNKIYFITSLGINACPGCNYYISV